ncbi:MAG: hypothetical protein R2741_10680 [Methanolobus sp.]
MSIFGKYAHRPVNAEGYMFIHCIFVGFKKRVQGGKGYASLMLDECIKEAKMRHERSCRSYKKGSFMAKKGIFIKKGFIQVDKAKPDFELLVLKFNEDVPDPKFRNMEQQLEKLQRRTFHFTFSPVSLY